MIPNCPSLTKERYCEAHKKQAIKQYDKERSTAAKRGYDARWRKSRKLFLSKYPLCKHCYDKGELIPANVVDHIQPHKGDKVLFWDVNNWQSLCKSCHDIKTATEDGGFGHG
ncbi:HNH endonuclease [Alkalihalophilus pseudofirmus]|nr:HNH endonuclease [Alkalihalophilus pseudofirmus]